MSKHIKQRAPLPTDPAARRAEINRQASARKALNRRVAKWRARPVASSKQPCYSRVNESTRS